jgi:hypothetical protein
VPFFSVCIPQFNRTSFLLEACRSLQAQRFRDFEVCISDDCSTDGREDEVLAWLQTSGLSFVHRRRSINGRYDANLRSAIDLASGRYCFLLGNDDVLRDPDTLGHLHEVISRSPSPDVVFTNFEDFTSGRVTRRVQRTGLVGSGPEVAAGSFRKFSFVSGVVLSTASAQSVATPVWDGSEMYQMYVGCRLIARGGLLLEADLVSVRKDVQLAEEQVDSYRLKQGPSSGIPIQPIPLRMLAALVCAAVVPQNASRRLAIELKVLVQYFAFLYPYWLFEYRRVQGWRFAAGVARAMRPARSLAGVSLTVPSRIVAAVTFAVSTIVGLAAPVRILRGLQQPATRLARRIGEWNIAANRP